MKSSRHTLASYRQSPFQDASGFDPAAGGEILADVDDSIEFGDDADKALVDMLKNLPDTSDKTHHQSEANPRRGDLHPPMPHLHRVA